MIAQAVPHYSPTVVRRGSHTAICLGRGRKLWRVIEMRSQKLTVERLTDNHFANRGYTVLDYDLRMVAQKFLTHAAGTTATAAAALKGAIKCN